MSNKGITFRKENTINSTTPKTKNQCLYKQEVLSSLLRLPTKIKQDGIIKSYNIENIERQRNNYYSRAISINEKKSNYDINSINNLNKIENIINSLNDLFNQIQTLFMKGKNCVKICNDWINIFNNNVDFIIEMTEAHEYLPLINNALNLIFFTILLIYDISNQNKFQFFFDEIKNILNIFMLLTESIFDRCKNKINLKKQSIVISVSLKDLNNNINKIVSNYYNINNEIANEFISLFKKLRRINTNDIYYFFQKYFQKKNNYLSNDNFTNENINNDFPLEYQERFYTQQDQIDNLRNSIKNYPLNNNELYTINLKNKNKPYLHNTFNSSLNPKQFSPGNILITDLNYVGAVVTNSGVIFPFRKSNKMRSMSINSNSNNIELNNKNYSHNTSPHYNVNIQYFNNNNIGQINLRLSDPSKNSYRNSLDKNIPLIPFSPIRNYTLLIYLEENIVFIPKGTNNIYLRPYLREFLNNIYPYYELFVFSESIKGYADQIIDFIEHQQKFFDYRLYRENSNYINNHYYLDIKKLGRDLKRIIVIDHSFIYENNEITITPFLFDENNNQNTILNDNVLIFLNNLLIKIAKEKPNDVRESLRKYKIEKEY